jgi:hypothetical protein
MAARKRTATRSGGRRSATRGGAKRKYGKAASKRVESAMRRRKRGTLRSGPGGKGGTVEAGSLGTSWRTRGVKPPGPCAVIPGGRTLAPCRTMVGDGRFP